MAGLPAGGCTGTGGAGRMQCTDGRHGAEGYRTGQGPDERGRPQPDLNTDLEDAASRLADWLVEDSTQLTTQSGLLTRKVPMTTGSGAMLDTNVYDFIDHSTSFLFLPRGVVIGLAMNNEWGFTGYLYAPPLSEAGSALRSYAAGCKQMGAVFIEYGGETYVVAMFA